MPPQKNRTKKITGPQSSATHTITLEATTFSTPPPTRTPEEQAIVETWQKRGRLPKLPTIKRTEEGISPGIDDHALWAAQLDNIIKTKDDWFRLHLLNQGANCMWKQGGEGGFNLTVGGLASIAPRDPLETLLAVQMLSVHHVAMELLERTMLVDQTVDGVTIGVKRATALFNVFAKQMDTLMRYRSGGKQTVVVRHQHVQVGDGGQAIVGTVNHSSSIPRGGGDETQK